MTMALACLGGEAEPVTHVNTPLNVQCAFQLLLRLDSNWADRSFGKGSFGDDAVERTTMVDDFDEEIDVNELSASSDGDESADAENSDVEDQLDRPFDDAIRIASALGQNRLGRSKKKKKKSNGRSTGAGGDDGDDADDMAKPTEGSVRPDFVNGNPMLVDFAEAFGHRVNDLYSVSLYEFKASCSVMPKSHEKEEVDAAEEKSDDEEGGGGRHGRLPNATFPFEQGPLMSSHLVRKLSKFKIPKFYPSPPRYPQGSLQDVKSAAARKKWKTDAHAFGQFALTVYRPWYLKREGAGYVAYFSDDPETPAKFNWLEYTRFASRLSKTKATGKTLMSLKAELKMRQDGQSMDEAEEGQRRSHISEVETIVLSERVARMRLQWIRTLELGLKPDAAAKKMTQTFRAREAQRWKDPTNPDFEALFARSGNNVSDTKSRADKEKKDDAKMKSAQDFIDSLAARSQVNDTRAAKAESRMRQFCTKSTHFAKSVLVYRTPAERLTGPSFEVPEVHTLTYVSAEDIKGAVDYCINDFF